MRKTQQIDRPTAKRAHKELDNFDAELLKERATLAANRVKMEYGILAHPTHFRLGSAYLFCIMEILPESAGAGSHEQGSRGGFDQTNFRQRILNSYYPPGWNADPQNTLLWCPVMKQRFVGSYVIAAYIVPYALGELNAAYLFGLEPQSGYEAIWDIKNGIPLLADVEKAFDAAQLVIVEDVNPNEFKIVILDESIMNQFADPTCTKCFRDLHIINAWNFSQTPDQRDVICIFTICWLFSVANDTTLKGGRKTLARHQADLYGAVRGHGFVGV